MSNLFAETYTLTFGDCAENHARMQKIGELAEKGLNLEELNKAKAFFESKGAECVIYPLKNLVEEEINCEGEMVDFDEVDDAYLLIVRKGINYLGNGIEADKVYREQKILKKDEKAFMYGRVVNKKARHNLCFSDFNQEPDYAAGKGTVYNFSELSMLRKIREKIYEIVGSDKVKDLQCEGNYYYDIDKTYIGWHGDSERKIVIAVRLGADFPIFYQWYYKGEKLGQLFEENLGHGDIYMMSEKAVGNDWKKKNIYTLRHAAGFEKNIKNM